MRVDEFIVCSVGRNYDGGFGKVHAIDKTRVEGSILKASFWNGQCWEMRGLHVAISFIWPV